jgi:hypothetical protein
LAKVLLQRREKGSEKSAVTIHFTTNSKLGDPIEATPQ